MAATPSLAASPRVAPPCRSYLEVDRGIMGVTRDDPDDPGNQDLV
jgi:hypothetical protein